MAKALELGADFLMIVDFTIEDDARFTLISKDWLIAAFEVDYF